MTHGLGLTVARIMQCTPSEDRSLDSNHHAQQQGFALRRSVSSEWSFPQLQILNGKGAIQYEYLRIILNYYSNRLSVEIPQWNSNSCFLFHINLNSLPCTRIALRNQLFCDSQLHPYSWKLLHISHIQQFWLILETITECCFNLFSVDDD